MNWRWYFTGLVVALAFFGMSLGQTTTNPNQEIVVRFNATSINTDAVVEEAIADIRSQLKSIGIENVHVSEILNGSVKVTYFSDKEVGEIKKLFLHQNKILLDDTAFNDKDDSSKIPFGETSIAYKLDVVKIQQDLDSNLGFHGTLIEIKFTNGQYLKPILASLNLESVLSIKSNIESAGCKSYPNIAFLINNTTRKIPEVRAGPLV